MRPTVPHFSPHDNPSAPLFRALLPTRSSKELSIEHLFPSEGRTIVRCMTSSHASSRRRQSDHLSLVRRPHRRTAAATFALYGVGLTIGFLLAALASMPGGGDVVSIQLSGAAVAALMTMVAGARARTQVVRARSARPRTHRRPTVEQADHVAPRFARAA